MKYAELTPEMERELVARYQAGDRDAGAELLDAHWPILVHLVQPLLGRGLDDEDVTQTACAEFLDGASKWDRSPGVRLTSWASQRAFYKTKTAVWESTTIRVSEYALTQRTRCRKQGVEPDARLASQLSLRSTIPLDAPTDAADDEPQMLKDAIPDNGPGPESMVARVQAQARRASLVLVGMGALDARDREILRRRYVEDETESLEEIGRSMGISKSRAGQLCERAKARAAESIRAIMSEDDAVLWGGEWRRPKRMEAA